MVLLYIIHQLFQHILLIELPIVLPIVLPIEGPVFRRTMTVTGKLI